MTISYNLGIPASGNNPSVDQPNMRTNNDNIPVLISVDHVDFNTSGSGRHLQVTFNSNNVPVPPVSPPVLFTKDDAHALPQIFYYTGDSAHSSNQYVENQNGSTMLFGGFILKWGKQLAAANNTTLSFTSAFPNNCYSVTVSGGLTSGTQPTINVNPGSVSVVGFTLKITGTTPVDVFYIAIGN